MSTDRPALEIRPARGDDVERLAELWALAFPGERTARERAAHLSAGGLYGGIETAWVGSVRGRLAGAFRLYDLTMYLFGRAVPTAGLAAVAVAPEFRRRGVGAALCRRALHIGRESGALFSALYPFRADFYQRLGYGLVGELHRYRFVPSQLPSFPGTDRVRALSVAEAGEVLPALYRSLAPASQGLLARPSAVWRELLEARHGMAFVVEDPEGAPAGYLLASVPGRPGRPPQLRVRELLVGGGDEYRAALGWISAQRDQFGSVVYDALPGERLGHVLAHPRLPATRLVRGLWFRTASILRGPMVRILDVGGLLELLEPDPGSEVSLADHDLPVNQGRWRTEPDGGVHRTDAEPGDGALPVSVASSLLAEGRLPGLLPPRPGFQPALGIGDFRMLDSF